MVLYSTLKISKTNKIISKKKKPEAWGSTYGSFSNLAEVDRGTKMFFLWLVFIEFIVCGVWICVSRGYHYKDRYQKAKENIFKLIQYAT